VGGAEETYIMEIFHLCSIPFRFHKVRKLKFPPASKMFHSDSLVTAHLVLQCLFWAQRSTCYKLSRGGDRNLQEAFLMLRFALGDRNKRLGNLPSIANIVNMHNAKKGILTVMHTAILFIGY
jgi:hypothetical protein